MSTDGFVGFLRGMGHIVRQTNDLYWYNEHPHVYTSFPFHKLVDIDRLPMAEVLGKDGWALRCPCEINKGRPSYRLTCTVRDYELSHLGSKARNQTRRGLEQCRAHPVSFEELAKDGLRLNSETLVRQGRHIPSNFSTYWQRYYDLASRTEGAHAWGVFVGVELAAYLIAFEMENVANVFIVRSSSKFLKYYPNNALFYEYLRNSLGANGYSEVSIGFESIRKDLASLDHFKMGMGFCAVPVGQRIELSPLFKQVLQRPVLNALIAIAPMWKHGEKLEKLGGLFEWYRDQLER